MHLEFYENWSGKSGKVGDFIEANVWNPGAFNGLALEGPHRKSSPETTDFLSNRSRQWTSY